MAKKDKAPSLNKLVQQYGANGSISSKEAMKISKATGASAAQVGYVANKSNIGLGAKFANQLGTGPMRNMSVNQYAGMRESADKGLSNFLTGIQGVQLDKGQMYMGSTKKETTGYGGAGDGAGTYTTTSYTPIVTTKGMKGMAAGTQGAGDVTGKGKGKGKGKGRNKPGGTLSIGGIDTTDITDTTATTTTAVDTTDTTDLEEETQTPEQVIPPVVPTAEAAMPTSPFSFSGAFGFRARGRGRKGKGVRSTRIGQGRASTRMMPTSSQLAM